MRKKTSPRCSLEAIAAYKQIFPSTNAALEYLADGFPSLYTRTIDGIAGKFSQNELKLMIDAMNDSFYDQLEFARQPNQNRPEFDQ